jgi:hypothetical protein
MRILSDGKVGIGVGSATQALLVVNGDASITGELRVANTAGAAFAVGVAPTQVNTSHRSLQIGGNVNIQSYGTKGADGQVDYCHNVYLNQDGNYKLISADEGTIYRQGGARHEFYSFASSSAGSNVTVIPTARVLQLTAAPNLGARFVGDVQISPDHNVAPQATLVVSGDASITGELRIDGNVGIGAIPTNKLQVNGAVSITDYLKHDGDADTYLLFETDKASLYGGGLGLVVSDGKVGIGTAVPGTILHIKDAGTPTITLEDSSGGTQTATIKYDQAGENTLTIATQYASTTASMNRIQFAPADNVAMTLRGGGVAKIAPLPVWGQ